MSDNEIAAEAEQQPDAEGKTLEPDYRPHPRRLFELVNRNPTFGSAEHVDIGNWIVLATTDQYRDVAPADFIQHQQLNVIPGVPLTYGQIVALAGDLYGDPARPISNGGSEAARKNEFLHAFSTLQHCNTTELREILALMQREGDYLKRRMIEGETEDAAAGASPVDFDNEYAKATGGTTKYRTDGRFMQLAACNFDHFGMDAVKVYTAGHALAIEQALKANRYSRDNGPSGNRKAFEMYELALAYNAFADHFLTDLFAAGHLRVPRRIGYAQHGEKAGGIASKFQHDEDNDYGLFVRNAHKDCWKCYGDSHLHTQQGYKNAQRVRAAIGTSYMEVYDAFHNNVSRDSSHYEALKLAPDLETAGRRDHRSQDGGYINFAPAFIPAKDRNGNAIISARSPFSEPDTHHWKPTLFEHYGLNDTAGIPIDHIIEDIYNPFRSKYQTPRDVMPVPKAKPAIEWSNIARSGSPVSGRRVRYAIANYGLKPYAQDRDKAYHASAPGPWSDWVVAEDARHPVVLVPNDGDPRVVQRSVIRQIEGDLPQFDAFVTMTNQATSVADIHV